ncbi:polysaccharide biosynthesis protein [Membranihabitans maritimus]|uniref:polysaccharide biosynthesis protein n=1 Tax=Membranihabitans maritimus TaxID=2904244 RepID=UPI001F16DA39|nr:nucleoside-diphosphate sugar epimerase/dehydratase [Membranihabitans maritimus]
MEPEINVKKYLKQETPRWIILTIDLYVTLNTFALAYIISNKMSLAGIEDTFPFFPQVFLISLTIFLITGSYKGIIRHTGFKDAINVLVSGALVAVFLIALSLIFRSNSATLVLTIPIHIVITHFLLNTMVLVFLRVLYKVVYHGYVISKKGAKRTLIYGAHETGLITQHALNNDSTNNVRIVGYVDHDLKKVGSRINGLHVFSAFDIDEGFVTKHKIDEIIISYPRLSANTLQKIVDSYSKLQVQLKIIPAVQDWLNGNFQAKQIKAIKIEDLLGRPPIQSNHPEVYHQLKGKVILVTGAAGSIGSEISRQVHSYPAKTIIFLDQAESALYELQQECKSHEKSGTECLFVIADVCNSHRLDTIFQKYKPDIIYHAAAYKHVPLMENNPYEAIRNNIEGTKILADMAVKHRIERFVMVSTDKAVNPANVMGATKRVAELYVTYLNRMYTETNFIVTRFGNVLGSNGSVIPIFKKQIEKGGPLTVTHREITRFFMTIPEACQLVILASSIGHGGEVFVFDIGESMRIYDLAKRMIKLSGLRYPEDIDIKITGLRPGEKIYEELFTVDENTEKTQNEKIMIARVSNNYPIDFEDKINNLVITNHHNVFGPIHYKEIIGMIQDIVPEYSPKNSIFEKSPTQ